MSEAIRIVCSTEPSSSAAPRHIRRAHISPETLKAHKLVAGDWVCLSSETRSSVAVQLWPSIAVDEGCIALHAVQLVNTGEGKAVVRRLDPARDVKGVAKAIRLEQSGSESSDRGGRESTWVQAALKERLMFMRYVSEATGVQLADNLGSYSVRSVEVSQRKKVGVDDLAIPMKELSILSNGDSEAVFYEMDWRTSISLGEVRPDRSAAKVEKHSRDQKIKNPSSKLPSYINLFPSSSFAGYERLGGLTPQITQIRSLLELPLSHPELFTAFGLTPPRGILLHGPPGTGKTALARAVAASSNCACIVVNGPELSSAYHGESEERLRGVFDEAARRRPCIVVLDEIDALCPRRDADGGEVERRVVATLLTLMDGMTAGEGVFVVAATNRPNSVDPALRRPGRFDREIEVGIPDAGGREAILAILLAKMPHSLSVAEVSALAGRTHGFVGADLSSLIRESAVAAIQRYHDHPPSTDGPCLTMQDIASVLPTIRPSTMREVFIETPRVKWDDIGGQADIKQKLRECVEWPLRYRDTFQRLGVEAPRGVLLYGPPGCSKTLMARALASESGINFLAVKGPELLNKYVGESEKAVREIFRKARAASPSIIFFDEIDALGSERSDDLAHSGVLTSLLNEMDGIEELAGVTVVAATNRPDVLDSALMRPGRLDRILYVGAPDLQTRRHIFQIRLSKMAVEPGVNVDELAVISEGCSGAEVASICQDAALAAMNEDVNAPYVKHMHLLNSARIVRRRITPEMIHFFERWRDQSGVRSA